MGKSRYLRDTRTDIVHGYNKKLAENPYMVPWTPPAPDASPELPVNDKSRAALIEHFGTVAAIHEATPQQLLAVAGIGKVAVGSILDAREELAKQQG